MTGDELNEGCIVHLQGRAMRPPPVANSCPCQWALRPEHASSGQDRLGWLRCPAVKDIALLSSTRVFYPSCHPLISPSARIKKNNIVLKRPSPKMVESRTLVCLGVASSGVCHFYFEVWHVLDVTIFGCGQFRTVLFFLILALGEFRGWQILEGVAVRT